MNRSSFALFVALLIHLLLVILFTFLGSISNDIKKPAKEKKIRVSLKEIPSPQKESAEVIQPIEPIPEIPPMPKGEQLKKIVEEAPVSYQPKAKPKLNPKPKPKLVKPKQKVKKIAPLPPKKPFIPLVKEKKIKEEEPIIEDSKKEENPLYAMLSQDRSSEEEPEERTRKSNMASAGRNIQKLYGDEFGKLSVGQQKYILDNQEIMRRITQQVLNRQARVSDINNLNVNRSNVIEFFLHPNGDMTDFKFLQKSGYFILDDITRATIEYAYSKYPRPSEKTLIRYNVFYNLARY
ncbi:hypothetical protein [Sulfurimonas sp.]